MNTNLYAKATGYNLLGEITGVDHGETPEVASFRVFQQWPETVETFVTGDHVEAQLAGLLAAETQRETVRVKVHGPNLNDPEHGEDLHVHSTKCGANNKKIYKGEKPTTLEVVSEKDLTTALYSPEEFHYAEVQWEDYFSSIFVHDCVKLPAE